MKRSVAQLVAKFAKKREALQAIINDQVAKRRARYEARLKLQQLPRNASPARHRATVVQLTGRPRGVFRKFGLCRNKIRELAFKR